MKNIYIYILIGIVVLAVSYYIYSKKYDHYGKYGFCSKDQFGNCVVDCLGGWANGNNPNNASHNEKAYCAGKCLFKCDF